MLLCALLLGRLPLLAGTAVARPHPTTCQTDCATAIVPPVDALPFEITRGPLRSVWFSLTQAIGRIDSAGNITVYPVPTPNANVGWLTADPRGAVWFAERDTGKIGWIDLTGTITEYPLPSPDAVPQGIVLGPDGNLYITEQGSNAIARLNPRTGAVREFPVPTPDSTPLGLALGPDNALWFNELFGDKVGRITTGGVLTEYPVEGGPVGITVGNDGQLYLALFLAPGVTRVDLRGQVTGHWDLTDGVGPLQIAPGFGLDIWVTDSFGGKLYRVTPYNLRG